MEKYVEFNSALKDLKKKYDLAVSVKSRVAAMLSEMEKVLCDLKLKVLSNMYRAQKSLQRLNKIAFSKTQSSQKSAVH